MADSMFLDQFGLQEVMKNIGYQLKMLYNRADEIDNIIYDSFYWDGEYNSSMDDVINIGDIEFNGNDYDIYIPNVIWEGEYEKNNTGIDVTKLGTLSFASTDYTIYIPTPLWNGDYTSGVRLGTFYFGEEETNVYLSVSYELSEYVNIDEVEEYDSSSFTGSSSLLGTLTIGNTEMEIYGPRVSYKLSNYVNIDEDDDSLWANSSSLLGTLTIGNTEMKIYGPRIRYSSVYGSDADNDYEYMYVGSLYIGSPSKSRTSIYIPAPVWEGEYSSSTGVLLGVFTFGSVQFSVYAPASTDDYTTSEDLSNYITSEDLSNYITSEDLSNYITSDDLIEISDSDVESMISKTGVSFS